METYPLVLLLVAQMAILISRVSSTNSSSELSIMNNSSITPKRFGTVFNNVPGLLPNVNPGGTPQAGFPGTNLYNNPMDWLFGIGSTNSNLVIPGAIGTIGSSAVLIKGGFLSLFTAVKSIVIPAVLSLLVILFLIAGVAFFTCQVIDCSRPFNNKRNGLKSSVEQRPFFDRTTLDFYNDFRQLYEGIESGLQKYDSYSHVPQLPPNPVNTFSVNK